jgi:pimeloyl-ACP methyl ester carboxylesterase
MNETIQTATADVNGTKLFYRMAGDPKGPPVLLWHGFLATSHCWRQVMTGLAEIGFAVIAADMRGYGDSDKPSGTAGYDARALGEEFRSLVKQLGFGANKPLLLVGHDMGAPPALIWAADHPEEIAGLLYLEGPVMLSAFLTKIIAYTPQAMREGSMWWRILPLAPGVPERLIVGHERAFLEWFYDKATARREAITPADVDETLRTFKGVEGVLGAVGVYRAQFTSIEQTEPLAHFLVGHKIKVPVVALGGEKSLGESVLAAMKLVAKHVEGGVIPDCGHFLPHERPDVVIGYVRSMWDQISKERKDINFVTPMHAFGQLNRSPSMNTHSLSNKPIESRAPRYR